MGARELDGALVEPLNTDEEPSRRDDGTQNGSPRFGRRVALGLSLSSLGIFAAARLGFAAGEARPSPESPPPGAPATSLIVVWLGGGPSQLETFDPKPGTAAAGPSRAVATKVKGLSFGEFLPQVAEQADKIAVLRGVMGKEGDHERATILMKTGYRPELGLLRPSLGAICAAELPEGGLEIPRYVAILGSGAASRGGYLGPGYDAFRLGCRSVPDRVSKARFSV